MMNENRVCEMVYYGAYHRATPEVGREYTAAVRDHVSERVWKPVVMGVTEVKEALLMTLREKKTWI